MTLIMSMSLMVSVSFAGQTNDIDSHRERFDRIRNDMMERMNNRMGINFERIRELIDSIRQRHNIEIPDTEDAEGDVSIETSRVAKNININGEKSHLVNSETMFEGDFEYVDTTAIINGKSTRWLVTSDERVKVTTTAISDDEGDRVNIETDADVQDITNTGFDSSNANITRTITSEIDGNTVEVITRAKTKDYIQEEDIDIEEETEEDVEEEEEKPKLVL